MIDIGNEEVLVNTKIVENYVQVQGDDGNIGEKFTFYFDSYEECKEECDSR